MIEALRRVAALPGAEAERETLLDVARVIAEITVSAAMVREKTVRLQAERDAYAIADEVVKP